MSYPLVTCCGGQDKKRFSARWWLSKLLHTTRLGVFVKIQRNEYAILHTPSDIAQAVFMGYPYVAKDEGSIRTLVSEGDTVVDIGANVGSIALFAATIVGATGHVLAVEPHPRTFAFLSANRDLNPSLRDRISIRQVAVADRASTIGFSSRYHDSGNHVFESIDGLQVETISLDDLCRDIPGKIGLLKIDVEGYEPFVIRGGRETLARTRHLYFELCDGNLARFGHDPAEFIAEITKLGFSLYEDLPSGERVPFQPESLRDTGYCKNLIGCKK